MALSRLFCQSDDVPTPCESHQRSIFQRQKPLSPRKIIFTSGHSARSRFPSSARMAHACLAPSILKATAMRTAVANRKKYTTEENSSDRSIHKKTETDLRIWTTGTVWFWRIVPEL